LKRVLITGGSGFIGTNLVELCRQQGHRVVSLDSAAPRCREHAELWRQVDILDPHALSREVQELSPEIVFHLAARTDLGGRNVADYRANTDGVGNMVESLALAKDLQLAVFASSMLVCRIGYQPRDEADYCPSTQYGESKVAGERIVRESAGQRLPWVIVRPTSIWGPWFRAPYRDFFDMVRRGLYFHPRRSRVMRSYGYVGNAVHLLTRLADLAGGALLGRTTYLADFMPLDILSWAEAIARQFGTAPVRQMPIAVFRLAARAGDVLEKLGANPPMTTFRLQNMLTEMVYDLTLLRAVSAELPYTVEEGVRLTCEWMRRSAE
jgi:nucleoside-diphosphate-sugar epimerase